MSESRLVREVIQPFEGDFITLADGNKIKMEDFLSPKVGALWLSVRPTDPIDIYARWNEIQQGVT